MGHSMGGCGALMIACRKSEMFKSMSAIAPRCSPSDPGAGWAKTTYQSLLGDELLTQQSYDPVCLLKKGENLPPGLIDIGTADDMKL